MQKAKCVADIAAFIKSTPKYTQTQLADHIRGCIIAFATNATLLL